MRHGHPRALGQPEQPEKPVVANERLPASRCRCDSRRVYADANSPARADAARRVERDPLVCLRAGWQTRLLGRGGSGLLRLFRFGACGVVERGGRHSANVDRSRARASRGGTERRARRRHPLVARACRYLRRWRPHGRRRQRPLGDHAALGHGGARAGSSTGTSLKAIRRGRAYCGSGRRKALSPCSLCDSRIFSASITWAAAWSPMSSCRGIAPVR